MNTKKIIGLLAHLVLLVKDDEEGVRVNLIEQFKNKELLDVLKTIDGSEEVVKDLERYLSLPSTWNMSDKAEIDRIEKEADELYTKIYNFGKSETHEMPKKQDKEVVSLLANVFKCCEAEDRGSAEHITEYVDVDDVKYVAKILGYNDLAAVMDEYLDVMDKYEEDDSDENEAAAEAMEEKLENFVEDYQ